MQKAAHRQHRCAKRRQMRDGRACQRPTKKNPPRPWAPSGVPAGAEADSPSHPSRTWGPFVLQKAAHYAGSFYSTFTSQPESLCRLPLLSSTASTGVQSAGRCEMGRHTSNWPKCSAVRASGVGKSANRGSVHAVLPLCHRPGALHRPKRRGFCSVPMHNGAFLALSLMSRLPSVAPALANASSVVTSQTDGSADDPPPAEVPFDVEI